MPQHVPQVEVHEGGVEEETVEEVEDAANAGEESAGILHAGLALEERFDQVAHHGGHTQHDAQHDRMERGHPGQAIAQQCGQAQRACRRNNHRTN